MVTHWASFWRTTSVYGGMRPSMAASPDTDGIARLLSLLPDGWREWATMVADKYIITAYPAYDLVGDFPRFLTLRRQGSQDVPASGSPKQGHLGNQLGAGLRGHRRHAHLLCWTPLSPWRQSVRRRRLPEKREAPAADSEEDEEEGPPVVAPVGSSRLQSITVPSSYSHIRSATEADHPDMGRRMVRVDDIWPHLRKAGNEAVPPALTEESSEDPHLLWEWACGEDENNPILVNSEEERVPKRERSPDSDSDSDSDDIRDCGYYTPSGSGAATGKVASSWSWRRATQQAAAMLVEELRTPPNSAEGEKTMEEGVPADWTPKFPSRRGASPEEYVRAYQTYQRCYGDSLGEFLAHNQRLWWDAAIHGSVTGYDGIARLLSLLPDGWREWATMVADKYIITAYPAYDLDPPAPREPGRPSQWESEAGPSRQPVGSRTPRAPPARPPSMRDPTFPMEAAREAQEAARKGEAPAADSEKDEEEGPPVVTPVGSSRLQSITVPSSYSHIRSATEADHPDMGRRMVRVDDIWPHLRKAGNEAVPPALTEESSEDPHLLWEWACGEDENNPILVNSEEERVPKRERSPDSDSDSDSDDIRDCGYYTPSGSGFGHNMAGTRLPLDLTWGTRQKPVRVLDATGCMAASAWQGLIPASIAEELDTLLRTVQARTQGREQDLTRQLSARNCAQ
ncbi:hypothetical protein SASPL_157923 [Salvia splendens]|uniref:Uncharacterized protein n=1 Tax=Salvia splendens TaxID=180675 RepID=A0A8X8VU50_SALSN|nr:hypothetical protein SASPL_157923 [Salvia splendens]